jgi:hypothetical protein
MSFSIYTYLAYNQFLFEILSSLQARYVPPAPHPAASWHNHPLPEQRKIPDLKVVTPPLHLVHDNRFPPLKDS